MTHMIDYDGEDMVFGFNPFHVMQGVEQIEGERLVFEFTDPSTMACFREQAEGIGFLYVVSPMSVSK